MTKFFNGTKGNDSFVGDLLDVNVFSNIGIGSDRAVGGRLNDRFNMQIDGNVDLVDGGAGRDTIDYSATRSGLNINLATGLTTARLGINPFQEVTVTEMRNIEDVVGTSFSDRITGSSGANRLDGGAGNDVIRAGGGNDTLMGGSGINTLDGGTGIDTADYSSADHMVFAFLDTGTATEIDLATGTTFAHDTLIGIENITGSRFNDSITGTAGNNLLNGGDGSDTLTGMGGNDTIHGGDGNDFIQIGSSDTSSTALFGDAGDDLIGGGEGADLLDGGTGNDLLFGSAGEDTLLGGDGNDRLDGGTGADTMDGGAGVNTVVYRQSLTGVSVNLETQFVSGGDAGGDTISNIQNVWGSFNGDDSLVGSAGDNTFYEQGGNNFLVGGLGHDTFAFSDKLKGSNLVADFVVGEDRLAFDGVHSMDELNFTQLATGTLVTIDNASGSIFLLGVDTQSLLESGDILLANSVGAIFLT